MEIGPKQALRVRSPVVRVQAVYIVAPETQYLFIPNFFRLAAPRLRVLASNASDAYYRETGTPNEDEGEGKDKADLGRDVLLRAGIEALGTVAGMEKESFVPLYCTELITEALDLCWSDEGRQGGYLCQHAIEILPVGILYRLESWFRCP